MGFSFCVIISSMIYNMYSHFLWVLFHVIYSMQVVYFFFLYCSSGIFLLMSLTSTCKSGPFVFNYSQCSTSIMLSCSGSLLKSNGLCIMCSVSSIISWYHTYLLCFLSRNCSTLFGQTIIIAPNQLYAICSYISGQKWQWHTFCFVASVKCFT